MMYPISIGEDEREGEALKEGGEREDEGGEKGGEPNIGEGSLDSMRSCVEMGSTLRIICIGGGMEHGGRDDGGTSFIISRYVNR